MNHYQLKTRDLINKIENRIVIFFIVIYAVGIGGISIRYTSGFFTSLIPVILLLSLFSCLIFHKPSLDSRAIFVFLTIIILSFFIEVAGVQYGVIFGNYAYGTSLGIQLFGTPIIIGLNWLFLVYCTGAITEKLKKGAIARVFSASFLMLIYDLLLEISAPILNMWSFEGGRIPFRNYAAWFFIALFFHSLLRISRVRIINKAAPWIFSIQLLFFIFIAIIR